MAARACCSSSLSTTVWPRNRTVSPSATISPGIREQGIQQEWRRAGGAQVRLGDPRLQRILAVELANRFDHPVARRLEPCAVHVPGLRLRNGHEGSARRGRGNFGFHQSGARHQAGHSHAEGRLPHQQRDAVRRVRGCQNVQPGGRGLPGAPPTSSTTPPPMVATGENMRMMKRSPGNSRAASRNTSRTYAAPPGWSGAVPSSSRTWASISAVPQWKCTGARCFSGFAVGSKLEPAIHLCDGAEHSRLGERIAARQLRRLDVRQVHRRALAGHGAVRRWRHAPGRRARAAAVPRGRARPPAPWRPSPRPACRWPPCRSLSP